MPERIHMSRVKGWRKPPGAVYVGRPSRYGNPFKVAEVGAAPAVDLFRPRVTSPAFETELNNWRHELRGCDLACWCALDQPRHADVLLELVNKP